MEIIFFSIIVLTLMAMAILAKEFPLVSLMAGIGLIMMALFIQTSGIQITNGFNMTEVSGTQTQVTPNYMDITMVFSGLDVFITLLTIIIGAIGVLFILYSQRI